MSTVVIDGESLTLEEVAAVAREFAQVEIKCEAKKRVRKCRAVVERLLKDQARPVVYGVNTGFGSLRNILIESDKLQELQKNLIHSHSCGVGPPAPVEVVRAMMLLRANTLAKGYSGVRLCVIQTLVDMLNKRVHPVVPVKGSVGASGDLAPLSHLVLVMMGEGEALTAEGDRIPGDQAMLCARIDQIKLDAKEGLALNNGTQFMTAIGVLAILDAEYLVRLCASACGMSLEAIKGVPKAFDERIHKVRPHKGQQQIAKLIRRQIKGSQILGTPVNTARLHNALDCLNKAHEKAQLLTQHHLRRRDRKFWRTVANSTGQLIETLKERIDSFQTDIEELRHQAAHAINNDPDENIRQEAEAIYRDLRKDLKAIYGRMDRVNLQNYAADARDLVEHACNFVRKAMDELDQVVPSFLPVQDDYSFRCTPQVCGAAMDTFRHVRKVLEVEINSATDNPLIFPPDSPRGCVDLNTYKDQLHIADCMEAVVSGGNFHGEPIAIALDQACIALAELGNLSERRTFHLTSGHLNNGLPSFLTPASGLHSGLMVVQYTAAALVSENKTLSHPASVDSIPTCEDTEDHVSMGAYAARKLADVLENVRYVLAIELICATQGIELRAPAKPSSTNEDLMKSIRRLCKPLKGDRQLSKDIEAVAGAIRCRSIPVLVKRRGEFVLVRW